jgi:hypothetical protein
MLYFWLLDQRLPVVQRGSALTKHVPPVLRFPDRFKSWPMAFRFIAWHMHADACSMQSLKSTYISSMQANTYT